MATARQIRANRANARASTGPRTAIGKIRASRNAFRHGLSVPVRADPLVCNKIEAFARQLVGDNAVPEIYKLALAVAEAQVELIRIRNTRNEVFGVFFRNPYFESRRAWISKKKFLRHFTRGKAKALDEPITDEFLSVINSRPTWTQKFILILDKMASHIATIDRYERRALSWRKFAMRELARATTTKCG
jgi:hypothetical protein